jgi:hypothetical protein
VTAQGLTMTRESRAFRAYQVAPGSAPHRHTVPTVVVLISGDAATHGEAMNRAGAAVYIPAGDEHRVTGQGHVVEVESANCAERQSALCRGANSGGGA